MLNNLAGKMWLSGLW